jgi:hypothetical protein
MGYRVRQIMDENCCCVHEQDREGYWSFMPVLYCPIHGAEEYVDAEIGEMLDRAYELDEADQRCA